MKPTATLENPTWQGIEALSPPTLKQLTSVNKHRSLEIDPSRVEPLDETLDLVNTLIAVLWETMQQRTQLSYAEIPDQQQQRS